VADPVAVPRPEQLLIAVGGGYLRNPVRKAGVTCADCVTPVAGFERCYPCHSHHVQPGLADVTAFLTYAVAGQESGYLMRGYKAPQPVAEHRLVVGLLLHLALSGHTKCAGLLAGLPVIDDTWTTGGHAQSAALALRVAGATRVSVLVVARWLKEDYGDNKQFIDDLRGRDYDPSICPWTGAKCP
jgi:predicted amidophosphoribosyltransferase